MKSLTTKLLHNIKSKHRKNVLMTADVILISACYWFAWIILARRIDFEDYTSSMGLGYLWFMAIFLLSFVIFKMYDSLWRYAGFKEYLDCISATAIAGVSFCGITYISFRVFDVDAIPMTVYCLAPQMVGMSTLCLRMFYRAWKSKKLGTRLLSGAKKTLVVGAGNAGCTIIRELSNDPNQRHDVVCVVDDKPQLRGHYIQQIKVEGTTNDIPKLVQTHGIDIIIIAIPSMSKTDIHRIAKICEETKCIIKKLPPVLDVLAEDKPLVKQIQNIRVEDLLGRSVIDVNIDKPRFLEGKTVLITGAGGSIGSELCRQAAIHGAARLVMFDISENGLYDIQQELLRKYQGKFEMCAEVASIRDEEKLNIIFGRYKPDIVYHAAAHKHVPLMEDAPEEAVKNNIFGTLKTARCAAKHGVKRFVMISTDKAVNPTSIMGATKRVCEMVMQVMNEVHATEFVAVRFGNVLGSNGSVIPLFKKQIEEGGPVTVTDERITRYFMTIPEAVGLVMTAGEMAKGGEIFVLDMGEPIKIMDVAETMIKMAGYEPYKDIDILITGLRPGEKLYEELLTDTETLTRTHNDRIFVDKPIDILYELFTYLNILKKAVDRHDDATIMKYLNNLVPELAREREKASAA